MPQNNLFKDNIVMLAPLAGITDLAYRRIATNYGADFVFTEMVSAKAITYKNKKTKELLYTDEKNLGVQLFGSEPEVIKEAIQIIDNDLFLHYNLNAGCPVPKIVGNGEGSALLKKPKLLGDIVKAMRSSTKKPISVKVRSGFEGGQINAEEIAKVCEENGADYIIIHGRTRNMYYNGEVDYDIIKKVKESVAIPVIGNGDIFSYKGAKRMYDSTGVDGIMVARGAIGNPFIFKKIKLGSDDIIIPLDEFIGVIRQHKEALIEHKGGYIGFREFRKHLSYYVKGRRHASALRNLINKMEDDRGFEEIVKILRQN